MTIAEHLRRAQSELIAAGISSARLDALILIEDELGKDRAWLLANQDTKLSAQSLKKLNSKIARRASHEPLAYIRGFTEFYGRRFMVNKEVLEPRPESETMIEMLLGLPKPKVIADIGTGSGALAITAKLEIPEAMVFGVDIDPNCLNIARKNAKALKAEVKFYKADLLNGLAAKPDVILANLPYVPRNVRLNQSAEMEPKLAIDGGGDGLDVYRRFFEQLSELTPKPKYILTEALPPQHLQLAEIASQVGYQLAKTSDLIQLFEI